MDSRFLKAATGRLRALLRPSKEGSVVFPVCDNGPGIAAANLEHIFDRFFSTKDAGIGTGLAICQSIIDAHGGHISGSNRPNGGAHFPVPTAAELDSARAS